MSEKLYCLKGLKIQKQLLQKQFFQNLLSKNNKLLRGSICRPSKCTYLNVFYDGLTILFIELFKNTKRCLY